MPDFRVTSTHALTVETDVDDEEKAGASVVEPGDTFSDKGVSKDWLKKQEENGSIIKAEAEPKSTEKKES